MDAALVNLELKRKETARVQPADQVPHEHDGLRLWEHVALFREVLKDKPVGHVRHYVDVVRDDRKVALLLAPLRLTALIAHSR